MRERYYAEKLIKKNYSVLGIDYSDSMIKLAERRVPGAGFVTGSIYKVSIPSCVGVIAVGEVLNYKFDENAGYKTIEKLFRKIYHSLEKGGVFIFDILEVNQLRDDETSKTFTEGKTWTVLTEKKEDKKRNELERRIVIFNKVNHHYKRQEEIHRVKLYKKETLLEILIRTGFRCRHYRSYGRYKLRNNQSVFVCTK